jgi:hypothetical protein
VVGIVDQTSLWRRNTPKVAEPFNLVKHASTPRQDEAHNLIKSGCFTNHASVTTAPDFSHKSCNEKMSQILLRGDIYFHTARRRTRMPVRSRK